MRTKEERCREHEVHIGTLSLSLAAWLKLSPFCRCLLSCPAVCCLLLLSRKHVIHDSGPASFRFRLTRLQTKSSICYLPIEALSWKLSQHIIRRRSFYKISHDARGILLTIVPFCHMWFAGCIEAKKGQWRKTSECSQEPRHCQSSKVCLSWTENCWWPGWCFLPWLVGHIPLQSTLQCVLCLKNCTICPFS